MSQLNVQALKTLTTNVSAITIDAIKMYNGKSQPYKYCEFSHKFVNAQLKRQYKMCLKIGCEAKVCRNKYRKAKQSNDRSIISLLDLQK